MYIPVEGTITVIGEGADAVEMAVNRNNKLVICKNWAPFTECISKINNACII